MHPPKSKAHRAESPSSAPSQVDSTIAVSWETVPAGLTSSRGSARAPIQEYNIFSPENLSFAQLSSTQAILDGNNAMVKAVAGAGKTRTALTTAIAFLRQQGAKFPDMGVVMIAYNKRLREEVLHTVAHEIEPAIASRLFIHTYYSLKATYFGFGSTPPIDEANEDDPGPFENSLRAASADAPPRDKVFAINGSSRKAHIGLVVLDEIQDMTPTHHFFFTEWLKSLALHRHPAHPPPRLMLVGDPCQLVYGYRSATIKYMQDPDTWFRENTVLVPGEAMPRRCVWHAPFITTMINESFRVPPQIAGWVNEHLNPSKLMPHYPNWAASVGASHVLWWAEGLQGKAPPSAPVSEVLWKAVTEMTEIEGVSKASGPARDSAAGNTELNQERVDAIRKLGAENVDEITRAIHEYGTRNTVILAVTLSTRGPKRRSSRRLYRSRPASSSTANVSVRAISTSHPSRVSKGWSEISSFSWASTVVLNRSITMTPVLC